MSLIAGVDEVGRGPLAGPVVAGAVVLPEEHGIEGLRDSKKLTKNKREALFPIIISKALGIGIGEASVEKIDEINIREATFLAMDRALMNLPMVPDKALVDGEALRSQKIPNEGVIKGDDKIDSIKAASIIAKVTRDRMMVHYGKIFPEYGFEKHSGYGTKMHMEALRTYKATPIHRRSFAPIKKQMPTINWLKENNRISWMCEKLAGLYLVGKNYKILKIEHDNSGDNSISIYAEDLNNKTIYAVVKESHSENSENKVLEFIKREEIQNLKGTIGYHLVEDDIDQRFDLITVQFVKNNSPLIKHFKGII